MSVERGPRRGWRRALRLLVLSLLPLLLLALLAGSILWVRRGETFQLRAHVIRGACLADSARLAEVLDGRRGTPLVQLDLDLLKAELAGDPWITGLRVVKRWPDAVEVEVSEDEALAWAIRDGRVRILSTGGRLLPLPRSGVALDLPVLAVPADEWLAAAAGLVELKHAFPALYAQVARLEWGQHPVLRLEKAPPRVMLNAGQWRHGLSLLSIVAATRPDLLQRDGELDLRFVNQVVWRKGHV